MYVHFYGDLRIVFENVRIKKSVLYVLFLLLLRNRLIFPLKLSLLQELSRKIWRIISRKCVDNSGDTYVSHVESFQPIEEFGPYVGNIFIHVISNCLELLHSQ